MTHTYLPWRMAGLAVATCGLCIGTLTLASADTVTTEAGPAKLESLAKLDNPWGVTLLPDGGYLISEKPGRLRIFKDGKLSEPIAGVPEVAFRKQGGLLDVEIDPDFERNKFVYISYAEPDRSRPNGKDTPDPRVGTTGDDPVIKGGAVARGRLDGMELKDVRVIWRQQPKLVGRGHFGGKLAFARDGSLFITSGDRQRFIHPQDVSSNVGKIIRINADGSIPKDNPKLGGAADGIYSMGHRNPLGIAIDPITQNVWINEMGPLGGDELNLVVAGKNYGWPQVSEGDHYNKEPIPRPSSKPEFTQAAKVWNPVISPSGMIFYTGDKFPGWKGSALIGGLSSQALIRVKIDGDRVTGEERIDIGKRVRDVIQDRDGTLLLLIDANKEQVGGELMRLSPQ
ncbi:MAG: PQQ-dependent sugar dehydrogenase [Hyphomicrobiales bacterium]|nr:PQQ-dependent sugar dehydrogenase [Hyphomicrobiales bacterium]